MTFIIAEVGSNWETFQDAKDSIQMAKQLGADAVKFQLYTEEELYGFRRSDTPIALRDAQLPIKWLPQLAEKARAAGIEFMCTAFSPEGVDIVDPYVKRHKIASSEATYPQLLSAVASKRKPMLLSTGGCSTADLHLAKGALTLANLLKSGNPERLALTLLYCVTAYPAKNVNLYAIDKIRELYSTDVGYSCHTNEWSTPVYAVRYHGATVIEKHFKLRDNMRTPDAPHSLNIEEFQKMVKAIRTHPENLVAMPDPQEQQSQLTYKRRLIATLPISKGTPLKFGYNYGVYRSWENDLEGISGFFWQKPHEKKALVDIAQGDPIGPGSFEN